MSYVGGDVLGAFDRARWDAYQEAVRTGQPWEPNSTLEDPNGGIIHFDADGANDYYEPPARPITDATIEQDPNSTFAGWTEYERAAFWAAQVAPGPSNMVTDYLRARAKFAAGSNVASYDPADVAESDRQLRAFAATNAKVQDALAQLKVGPFRGTAGQAAYEANEAQAIQNQAEEILREYLAFRDAMIRQNPANVAMPLMPDASHYGTDVSDAVIAALRALVAKLPPPPPPPPPQTPRTSTTTTVTPSAATTTTPTAQTSTPASTSASANYGTGAAPARPVPTDAAPRSSMAPGRDVAATATLEREFPTKWVIGGFAALLLVALVSQARDGR